MTKIYNLCVAAGKYTLNGQEKTTWKTVGGFFKDDKGKHFITLDRSFNPAGIPVKEGSDSIFISLFPPKDNNQQRNTPASQTYEAPQGQQHDFKFKDNNFTSMEDNEFPF